MHSLRMVQFCHYAAVRMLFVFSYLCAWVMSVTSHFILLFQLEAFSIHLFSHITKLLGRTETRTRDGMDCQSIRTVWDISLEYGARIATCSLLTATDIFKTNYSIDYARLAIPRTKLFSHASRMCTLMCIRMESVLWRDVIAASPWRRIRWSFTIVKYLLHSSTRNICLFSYSAMPYRSTNHLLLTCSR